MNISKEISGFKKTPLYDNHMALGGRMIDFSGWCLPVSYAGIIEEHFHTREAASIFDISHMGEFIIKGTQASQDADNLLTCRIDDMSPGKCRYGFLLNNSGTILDDLIIYKISDEEFMFVVNAGTLDKDRKWIEEHLSAGTIIDDISCKTAKIDVQGPLSGSVMSQIAGENIIQELKRFHFCYADIKEKKVLVSRTGYTGELGYELFFDASAAGDIWEMLLSHSEVKPAGFGARDTLRMEMGYCLYGSDIGEDRNPFQANLARFVFMDKQFIGKEGLQTYPASGEDVLLSGFLCSGRRAARKGFDVYTDGEKRGVVTSGAFSPSLKKGMGLCYIDRRSASPGQEIILSDGKIKVEAVIEKFPLLKR